MPKGGAQPGQFGSPTFMGGPSATPMSATVPTGAVPNSGTGVPTSGAGAAPPSPASTAMGAMTGAPQMSAPLPPTNNVGQMTTISGQGAPAPAPLSMPAGLPPAAPPDMQAASKVGGAPVNGGPAKVGMSPAADAQKQMMQRAGVKPLSPMPAAQPGGATSMGGAMTKGKPAPVSRMEPKPNA